MSRRKLPDVSWRQLRVAAAAALAVLLTAAYLIGPADAKPDPAPPRSAILTPSVAFTGPDHAATAIKAQVSAQAAAHRQALDKARKATEERQAREHAAQAAAAARERARAAQAREARQARQRATRSTQRQQLRTPAAAPATVSGARAYARSRMSAAQYQCLTNVVSRESGWNHRAVNASSGAYGLFQALPGAKMASAGSDWRTNPLTQMRWGLSYIHARYGTPCGAWYFWTKNGWY
ncbi:aggregation-promoting factor C-terminal-like domain-containing protein [Streptomyces sp. NPDC001089]